MLYTLQTLCTQEVIETDLSDWHNLIDMVTNSMVYITLWYMYSHMPSIY